MNVRVVSGLNFDVKVVHKDFYEELKKIDEIVNYLVGDN